MWEYENKIYIRRHPSDPHLSHQEMRDEMNEMGRDGWEAYDTFTNMPADDGSIVEYLIWFKRWIVSD